MSADRGGELSETEMLRATTSRLVRENYLNIVGRDADPTLGEVSRFRSRFDPAGWPVQVGASALAVVALYAGAAGFILGRMVPTISGG